jgi:sterol desaturase/sphingolipid hydroxylase (fatty acid hydroxylase superfamily)
MDFIETFTEAAKAMLPAALVGPLLLIPFIVAEQIWPVHRRPGLRDYGLNILISVTTVYLALPAGIAGGILGEQLRELSPWSPLALSFEPIAAVPLAGPSLEVLALTFAPLIVHDIWFYWAHRIEHRVPFLWEFHKLHHSDDLLNASTYARDHFLQAVWIGFFPIFTIGLFVDLSTVQAGEAALYSTLFLVLLSMFYHSAIRVRVPWLNRVFVTPQVHRIHHSTDPAHYDRNFADVFPVFDMLFGTYHPPGRDEFPATGLGPDQAPKSLLKAQFQPVLAAARTLWPKSRARVEAPEA